MKLTNNQNNFDVIEMIAYEYETEFFENENEKLNTSY